MEFAVITAPKFTHQIAKGKYHMVLAQWVFTRAAYSRYYAESFRQEECIVILDNGAFERRSVSPKTLTDACRMVRADVVVLPDVLYDGIETCRKSWDALASLNGVAGAVMFNPQGNTLDEYLSTLDQWMDTWVKYDMDKKFELWIGWCQNRTKGAFWRGEAWEEMKPLVGDRKMHLLGVAQPEVFFYKMLPMALEIPNVVGVDTSLPFQLGYSGRLLGPHSPKIPLKLRHQYKSITPQATNLIHVNVQLMKAWCWGNTQVGKIPKRMLDTIAYNQYYGRPFSNLFAELQFLGMPDGYYVDNENHLTYCHSKEEAALLPGTVMSYVP